MITDQQYAEAYAELSKYDDECDRVNMRLLKAIGRYLGPEFIKCLDSLTEDLFIRAKMAIVHDVPSNAKFQEESDYGMITGIWVEQYSVGDSGDSFAGHMYVKLKNWKYLEIPYSC